MKERLLRLSLREILHGFRERRFSCEDYLRACLERIARTESGLRAWAFLDAQDALRKAKRADDRRRAGDLPGPLAGLPIGVKDILATLDMPTEMGSPLFARHQPRSAAACVERLQAAGAYVLGKTVTTEFAFLAPSKTRNPWNLAHTPGGSSAGSAAAVAAGHVPAAIGTQTNGSVIRPAAFCGVIGFKPGKEVLPVSGAFVLSSTLDQLGVFARRVEDAALLAGALGSAEMLDATTASLSSAPRILALVELPWVKPDEDMRRMQDVALQRLRDAGAEVTLAELPAELSSAAAMHRLIMLYEMRQSLGAIQEASRDRLSPQLNAALDAGREIGEDDYRAALAAREVMLAATEAFIGTCDALLLPPAPGGAPQGLGSTGDPAFCTLFSLTGLPALTLPFAFDRGGMPLGLQLAGRSASEPRLLSVAAWCEAHLGFRAAPDLAVS